MTPKKTYLKPGDLVVWINPWVPDNSLYMLVLNSDIHSVGSPAGCSPTGSWEEVTAWYFDEQGIRVFALPPEDEVDKFCTILSRVG